CFRSKSLDAYLAERQIEVQRIPAEAHWQISLAERSVQTIKAMMTALVSEQPQMRTSEAFARATWACNNRDQYLGFSPLQHAFGRAPDELGHLGESKLQDIPILTENGVSAEFGMNVKAMITAEKAFLEEQSKGKEWSRALGCFFVKQLRKQAVEISERHLTPEELVAPQWSAAVGMLLSKSNHGTVQEIIDTNKLLRKAKLGQHQKLRIHKCQDHKPLIAAWADAADSHRPDGGSTRGIFIGWTSHQLLQGDLVPISPVLWQSAKIQRTCRSSGAAETHAAIDAEDELFAV
ncbi:unnamed protein product, partial [Symbiodinium pilosum]